MKQEIKQRWVDALRSGKYEQGRGELHNDGKFCCLGVLCEILKDDADLPVSKIDCSVLYDGQDEYPPDAVTEIAELESKDPALPFRGISTSLTTLNDDEKLSFAELAELIETHF